MTSNLVSMDISSEEVNNNNQEKAGCSGAIDPALVFNRKEAITGDTSAGKVPAAAIVSLSGPTSPTASVYSLNDTFRIKVASAEEWLCVARMPRDFTQTELESLLDEFGPIHQCFLIHSEISGDFFLLYYFIGPKIDPKICQKSVQKSVQNASGLTQTELESLLDEFGSIHQCFLIDSEISGDFLCSITLSVKKLI